MQTLLQFAVETHGQTAAKPGFFEALGIDWKLLLLQGIAFLVLVFFLKKFVYPSMVKAIDDRQAAIEQGTKAAEVAKEKAAAAESDVNKMFKEARAQADEIVATAHKEALAMVEDAESKARKRADRIVSDAKAQLEQDVTAARAALRSETRELVALATEKIIKEKIDQKRDASLIESALGEAR
ncbi:ATP synthase F0 subunit B [Candidatus Saccharibacteria bacterium]|nr:MAG: ATP synthase F0 subunit B [Candidatus Saccharibacteria bacterium]